MSPPPVEMRGEEKHLDYIPGVSITLEMEVAKRADSSQQQEVRLPQNDSVDSETNPLMELNVLPEVNMMNPLTKYGFYQCLCGVRGC